MTRIAFVADVHVGNHRRCGGPSLVGINRRARSILDALGRAVAIAIEEDADAFVVLGDLFDSTRPTPQLIAAVQEILAGAPSPIVLVGNHERVSDLDGDHALGPLAPVARVVDRPTWIEVGPIGLHLVPWMAVEAAEALRTVSPSPFDDEVRLLGFHFGIRTSATASYLRDSRDGVSIATIEDVMDARQFSGVLSGHWHEPFDEVSLTEDLYARPIVQMGALAPDGWSDAGKAGRVGIFDSDDRSLRTIAVPGPRFISAATSPELFATAIGEIPDSLAGDLYVEWTVEASRLSEAIAELNEAIADGLVIGGEVLPDNGDPSEAIERAGRAASSRETLLEALAEYVGHLDLPDGVAVQEVLDLCRSYLGVSS